MQRAETILNQMKDIRKSRVKFMVVLFKLVSVVHADTRDKQSYALLFSTDVTLDARTIYRYYTARFQIEFVFRDAKAVYWSYPLSGTNKKESRFPFYYEFEPSQPCTH